MGNWLIELEGLSYRLSQIMDTFSCINDALENCPWGISNHALSIPCDILVEISNDLNTLFEQANEQLQSVQHRTLHFAVGEKMTEMEKLVIGEFRKVDPVMQSSVLKLLEISEEDLRKYPHPSKEELEKVLQETEKCGGDAA